MSQLQPVPNDHSAFARLHTGVQHRLWRMQWSHLRPLQVDAIHAVFDSSAPVLISAATASGKTEAAFLPILSQLTKEQEIESLQPSVRVLYVGPLRALINDQFQRLEDLCEQLEIPVHRWHGDVGQSARKKLLAKPSGILLLTPESLESLFVNRPSNLTSLFSGLQYIVIDELHAFLGTERGRQLLSLLARLEITCDVHPRRIGLTATLGRNELEGESEFHTALSYLSPDDPGSAIVIQDQTQKPLGYRVYSYLDPVTTEPDSDELIVERLVAADVAKHFEGLTGLIFANARGDVEAYSDLCAEQMTNDVRVHHGSLSREIRLETEERLKEGGKARPVTAFCSSTLELGIDLGDVTAVGQIGAPPTVASLKQRIGRSGRGEDQTRVMRVYLPLKEPAPDDDLVDRLFLPLIQTVAATELMLEGWVEPAREATCDLSTLTQQVISLIAQTGGLGAAEIHRQLCVQGAFRTVEPILFAQLLRALGRSDVIEQTPTGDLILGLRGERLRANRDFYAVFLTPEEYSLLNAGKLLGHLPLTWAPMPGEHLIFAGRRWQVASVDEPRMEIHVIPAEGRKRPNFEGDGTEVQDHLRERMRDVLLDTKEYPYLDNSTRRLLEAARREARKANLRERWMVPYAEFRTALFLWTGDRTLETVRMLLSAAGANLESSRLQVAVVAKHSVPELTEIAHQALALKIDPVTLAEMIPAKRRRKYDSLLSSELLEIGLARDWLDVDGAKAVLAKILTQTNYSADFHPLPQAGERSLRG